ncbi:MAG: hypothetical protein SH817_05995 [Leptospira sp.]|nr:hypothetical protein [Leptospira sp.]
MTKFIKILFITSIIVLNNCTYWPVANGLISDLLTTAGGQNNSTSLILASLLNQGGGGSQLDIILFDPAPANMIVGESQTLKVKARINNGETHE